MEEIEENVINEYPDSPMNEAINAQLFYNPPLKLTHTLKRFYFSLLRIWVAKVSRHRTK